MGLCPTIRDGNWSDVRKAIQLLSSNLRLGKQAIPTFGGMILNGAITAPNFISNIAIGISPFACTSTTLNTNLNADLWDGYQFSDYLDQAVKIASSPTFVDNTLTGLLKLPATSVTVGQIQQNSVRVFHTYGTNNIFIGPTSGNFETSGVGGNIGIGANALDALTTGNRNIAIGNSSGTKLTIGTGNTLIGPSAGYGITEGVSNMLFGRDAGASITTGSANVGIGAYAVDAVTTTNYNVGIGSAALGATTGTGSVGIGQNAGLGLTTGSYGIFIGYMAGKYNTLGNILIFDNTDRTNAATEITNAILYGVMAAAPANQTLNINANVGIQKTTAPSYPLDVVGDINTTTLYRANGVAGVSGSFTTVDLKTVTVVYGIITSIV